MLNVLAFRARRGQPVGVNSRLLVCPPALGMPPLGWGQRLRAWLYGSVPLQQLVAPLPPQVHSVRDEFTQLAADLQGGEAERLREAIACARSLRELWHLRATLFHLVCLQHDQDAAQQRLGHLNRHFPVRASRSGFAPL